jgi:hypothetical protein
MGILDYGANVLVKLKGDSKDLEAALKRATGAEKEALKFQIEGIKAGNTALEGKIKTLGKAALAVGGMVAAYKAAQASFEHYAQRTKLQSAAAGISIDSLRKASGGLKTEMELLSFAAKTNSGTFKLTEKQMGIALQAMRALERKGHDTTDVFNKVTTALTEAKSDALEPLGIVMEATGTKAERVNQIMERLAKETLAVGDASLTAEERQRAIGVQFEDSMGKIKTAIGSLVVAMQPLVQLIADIIGKVASLISKLGVSDLVNGIDELDWDWGWQGPTASSKSGRLGTDTSGSDFVPGKGWVRRDFYKRLKNDLADKYYPQEIDGGEMDFSKKPRKRGGGGGRSSAAPPDAMPVQEYFDWNLGGDPSGWYESMYGVSSVADQMGSTSQIGFGKYGPKLLDDTQQLDKMADSYQKFRTEKGQTFMEQAFGPLEQFDAYGAAFGVLTTTLTSGFDAWVNGSESFGQAMKAAFKQSLGAVASDMFAKSVQHAAYALGSLAFGDFRGAATHGAAAGAFAAGALTIGSLARSMGGGAAAGLPAGNTTGAGSTAVPVLPSYSGAPSGNRQVTLVIGDDFAEDSPRKRAAKAGRYLQMGMRATGPTGVAFA